MNNWYQLNADEVLQQLNTDAATGLAETEAAQRLEQYGPNALIERGLKSPWKILLEQLTNVMTIILIVAAVISLFLGDNIDAAVILAIVVLNAALGFRQEYKAEQSMAALKQLAVPVVKVRRGGQVKEISSAGLVPGDIILLETGNKVPADGHLLESVNLRLEEAALTGESEAVEKDAQAVYDTEQALGDRRNMVYMGTVVSYGHGLAVITATGMQTELGRIADLIQTVEDEPTPLQKRLDRLGMILAVVALVIVSVIFVEGLLQGEDLNEVFLTAVSLAVAAVPEGMAAVVTVALSLGAQRMLQRRALIRKLPAVETLGSVTVICSDKTGTLTQNKMTVTVLDIAHHRIDLTEREAGGNFEIIASSDQTVAPETHQPSLDLLLIGGALCNDAVLQTDPEKPGSYHVIGDSTEGALLLVAARFGLLKGDLDQAFPRIAELPFESGRKRMTTVHRSPQADADIPPSLAAMWARRANPETLPPYVAFTKGAVDGLLGIASQVWVQGRLEPLDDTWRQRIMASNDQLAQNGMRVLGVGLRPLEAIPPTESLEQELILLGLFGMIDPPRPEVKEAIAICRTAGIRPVMITGDHPLTARYIATELGMTENGRFLTGQELDRLSPEQLTQTANEVSVFARVAPEHKLDLVEVYQNQGHIVAMTGDGVNDAPALKKANIGVAMGITGTDVAKEAADMVLLDDNFATIVAAVEEGRTIFDNIRKFIAYLLTCNSSELGVMLLGPLLGMPLPLLPLQILWMNLVTDGLPALALSVEPAERTIMRRPPYSTKEGVFSRGTTRTIIGMGLAMTIVSLSVGYGYWQAGLASWQTMIFTTLVLSQVFFALAVRSERDSLFTIGLLSNRAMLAAVLSTFLLQLAVIYIPFVQPILKTTPLSAWDLALCLVLSTIVFWVAELDKLIRRRRTGG